MSLSLVICRPKSVFLDTLVNACLIMHLVLGEGKPYPYLLKHHSWVAIQLVTLHTFNPGRWNSEFPNKDILLSLLLIISLQLWMSGDKILHGVVEFSGVIYLCLSHVSSEKNTPEANLDDQRKRATKYLKNIKYFSLSSMTNWAFL